MQLTWAQLQRLADDFDLGRLVQMDQPLTTQCNTTDPFRTGQGTFLLRARHGEEFVERVEYLHYLIDYLVDHGFPAAAVVRSKKGKSWTLWGDRIVEVHKFVNHDPGVHRDWTRMNAAASILGDLHALMTEAASKRTPVAPEMRNDVSPRQAMALLDETRIVAEQSIGIHPGAERAITIVDEAQSALEPLMQNYERMVGSFPWMTIHGDFHFWNVLYRADQIGAVVDYDFAQERERLFDIAYAMQSVVQHLKVVSACGSNDFESMPWNNLRIWLDHYDETTHRPLSNQEREWLPTELLRVFLVTIATCATQEDPIDLILEHGDDLALFRWIYKQRSLFK